MKKKNSNPKNGSKLNPRKIRAFHNRKNKSFGFPEWVLSRPCISCGAKLEPQAIRGIGVKLNAQHFGNIALDVCCQACNAGYELHYKRCCSNMSEFAKSISSDTFVFDPKVVADAAFNIKPEENNLINLLFSEESASET